MANSILIPNKGRTDRLYDLEYWCSGKKVETLEWQKPIHIIRWRTQVLKDGNNYLNGTLKARRNKPKRKLKGNIYEKTI